ncbi:glycosyltransferase 87 family protein [Pseudonocardia xishanensis]|uniref:Alpha-1,2-mannosyltransferase n=1 Tax=Pseudonocardia xishanensis TaxID=630995 RepID=A0ABP8RYA1_9PSEU
MRATRTGSPLARRGVLVGAAVLVALQVLVLALWPAAHTLLIDLQVYVAGGTHVLAGEPLYAGGVLLDLPFVYPPIAAVLFVPLTLVPLPVLKIAWTALGIGLLVLVARRCAPALPAGVVTLLVAAALWLDPVRTTLYLGQINVVLLALVLLDLTGRRRGIALGIAAAIKLTPLLFVVYLLLTRRFRTAATALATFLAATALGFLVAPADSVQYWLRGTVVAADRISAVAGPSNHALAGTLGRLGLPGWVGLAGSAALACAVLVVAVRLAGDEAQASSTAAAVSDSPAAVSHSPAAVSHSRAVLSDGGEVGALVVVGLGSAAAAPFAWSHHYVWCVPLLVLLVDRRRWVGVAATLLVTAAVITRPPSPETGPIPATGLVSLWPDAYLVGVLVLLTCAARVLRPVPSMPPRSASPT